jgi:hypothetical protein
LGETFAQCLFFNETKSASTESTYFSSIEYNQNIYIIGAGVNDTDESQFNSFFNAMVIKTDLCGKTIWKRFLGKINEIDNTLFDIMVIDNYIYVLGSTQENSNQSTSFVAKLDKNGLVVWYKVYFTNNNDINCSRMIYYKNRILLYGNHEINQPNLLTYNFYILEIDTSGEIIKEFEYLKNNGRTFFGKLFNINNGIIAIGAANNGFKYGSDSVLYENGMVICHIDSNLNLNKIDTIGSQLVSYPQLVDYNPNLKKFIMHITKWISSDSTHRQIAFIDSAGNLEKIIEDPYSPIYYPKNLIAYQDGWVANWDGGLVKFTADYKKEKNIVFGRIDTGYFVSNNTSVVRNGTALLVTGGCKGCNPYDDNTDGRYERPTAIMIDSNFKDFGKAQPPYESPKPFAIIKAFPNPALESITLQITETAAEYTIYNSMGMFVSAGSMASSTDISLLNMASGMYIIQLKSPQGNYIGNVKFLKK